MSEQTFTVSDVCSLLEDLRNELMHRNVIVRNLLVASKHYPVDPELKEKLCLAKEQRKAYNVRYGRLYQAVLSYEQNKLSIEQLEIIYEQTRVPVSR